MKSLVLTLSAVALSLQMLGCAYGSGENDQRKQESEQREKLLHSFQPVVGTYEGVIQTAKRQIPVKIWVYIVDVQSGRNSSGEIKTLPSLTVRYRQLDILERDQLLDARFNETTGEIIAMTQAGQSLLNLKLRAVNDNLQGEALNSAGKLGDVNLNRVSREALAPADGLDNEFLDRAQQAYAPYVGTYTGEIRSPTDEVTTVEIKISYLEIARNNRIEPTLQAVYKATSRNSPLDFAMSVEISFAQTPARLSMAIISSSPNNPGGVAFTIQGTITEQGLITADANNVRGYMGVLTAQKQ